MHLMNGIDKVVGSVSDPIPEPGTYRKVWHGRHGLLEYNSYDEAIRDEAVGVRECDR